MLQIFKYDLIKILKKKLEKLQYFLILIRLYLKPIDVTSVAVPYLRNHNFIDPLPFSL